MVAIMCAASAMISAGTRLLIEGLEEELFVEAGQVAVGGDGEQLVAEVHEDAVVAGGVVGDGGFELGGHEARVAGGFEQVIEAGEELVAGGVLEDEPAADAAAERHQLGAAEALDQARVAGEDDTEELARVELLAGKDAQLVEDGGQRLLGLVDDEDRTAEGGGDVLGPARPQRLESGPAVVGVQRHAEEITKLAVEIHRARLGMLDGADDDVAHRLEPFAEQAQGDALAGARIARDHDVAAVGDAELDAAEKGVDGGRGVQGLDGDVGAEGVEFQAVQGLQLRAHGFSSRSWCWWSCSSSSPSLRSTVVSCGT